MRKILLLILLASASSCATKKPKVVYKYIENPVYIECQKLAVPKKPKFLPYQIFRVKFEDKFYYCADVENAKLSLRSD